MRVRRPLFIVVIALTVAGCAAIPRGEKRAVEEKLTAAGVQMEGGDKPGKGAGLRACSTRKMTVQRRGAASYYIYADPDVCNCLYVGTEPQYQEYQRLLLKKELADERLDESRNSGLWGPGPLW